MFDNQFEIFLADTDASKKIHFHLRYHVYCLRKGYENPDDFPDLLERDDYDDASAHFIVRRRQDHSWVGAVRVITAADGNLPIFETAAVDQNLLPKTSLGRVAEASRLSILPATTAGNCHDENRFGMRCDLGQYRTGEIDVFRNPWVALGLIRAARRFCLDNKIRYGFFLIADSLARMLRRMGVEIEACGALCNHRGLRRPYIHDLVTGYHQMKKTCPEIHKMFSQSPAYELFSDAMAAPKPQWQAAEIYNQAFN